MTEEVCANVLQLFIPLFSTFVVFGFAFSTSSFKDRIILFFDFDYFGIRTKSAYKKLIQETQGLKEDIEGQNRLDESIENILKKVSKLSERLRTERKQYPKKDLEALKTSHFNCLAFVSAMLSLFSITSSVIFSTLIYMSEKTEIVKAVPLVSFFLKAMFIGLVLSILILIYYINKDISCVSSDSEIKRNRILVVFLCVLPISILLASGLLFIPMDFEPLNFTATNSFLGIIFCLIFYTGYYIFYYQKIKEVCNQNKSKIDSFKEKLDNLTKGMKVTLPEEEDIIFTLSSSPKK